MTYLLLADVTPKSVGSYSIRDIEVDDAELIRGWRNAQLVVLRQEAPVRQWSQQVYFMTDVCPDFQSLEPKQILWMLLQGDERIGYGGLTHINWQARRGELSFLTAPERKVSYAEDFGAFLELVVPVAFEELGLHRIWHETYDIRPEHDGVLLRHGFDCEGRLRDHVLVNGMYTDSLIYGRING